MWLASQNVTDDSAAAEAGVRRHLDELGVAYELMDCDPALADTAAFCEAYGVAPEDSANTIVVVGKAETPLYVACVVLATTKLDVNKVVRKRLGVRKASFASGDETKALTGMLIGGVTPFGLPHGVPVWIDRRVMARDEVVVGGGSRSLKLRCPPASLLVLPMAQVVDDLAVDLSDR